MPAAVGFKKFWRGGAGKKYFAKSDDRNLFTDIGKPLGIVFTTRIINEH